MANGTRKIVLASRNEDKLRELRQICEGRSFDVVSALDFPGLPEVIEDGTTAWGNAGRKAIVTAAYTGEIAVADDTSFQVSALNDLPDVFASRFAGPEATYADNVRLVLELLREVPDGHRQARFETSMVWVDPRPGDGPGEGARVLPPARLEWLHNPFARAIEVKDAADEDAYWARLIDRKQVWFDYRTQLLSLLVSNGVDVGRVRKIVDELIAPFLDGNRPQGAPSGSLRLPEPRFWLADGPSPDTEPPTLVAPRGLPADVAGRSGAEPVWLMISTQGRLLGSVTREPLGTGGFGYDPIFQPEGVDLTLAELAPGDKNAMSHRARALGRLLDAAGAAYGRAASVAG